MIILIPAVFVPHNKKVESLLQAALQNGHVTSELQSTLNHQRNKLAHYAEEFIVLAVAALMVLKPF